MKDQHALFKQPHETYLSFDVLFPFITQMLGINLIVKEEIHSGFVNVQRPTGLIVSTAHCAQV
jgi:hypothetical protein